MRPSSRVTIAETNAPGTSRPGRIAISGVGNAFDLTLTFNVAAIENSRFEGAMENGLSFLQMRGDYTVKGKVGARELDFSSPGSAETFRQDSTSGARTN